MSFDIRSEVLGVSVFSGSFAPNGSSAVDATLNLGQNFSVTRTGTGAFSLVLRSVNGRRVVSAQAHLRLATPADSVVQVGSVTPSTTDGSVTIVLTVLTAGAAADIAANANNRISFDIMVA